VLAWPVRAGLTDVRVTTILSIVLICLSLGAAAGIAMRNDRQHALALAERFAGERAHETAIDLGAEIDRYTNLGEAFAEVARSAETSAALVSAGGNALTNIAVLDEAGRLQSELTAPPKDLLPLPRDVLAQARNGRAILPARDGRGFAIVFHAGRRIIVVALDARQLMPSASDRDALLASLSGRVVASGAGWRALPEMGALALDGTASPARIISLPDGNRLVSFARVSGWPLVACASTRVDDALGAWYGALPLYLMLMFGPALAGAGLAVVFVRMFEREARAAEAARKLRAIDPGEARLRVRLADAERRASDADRARRDFTGLMSHELRTPLNAIIGFSDVIEKGVFGAHPKYADYARDIGLAGRELLGRIADILDFADLEAGKRRVAPVRLDIAPLLREIVDAHLATAGANGVTLKTRLPESAVASADASALRRILGNLLTNALRYSADGGSVNVELAEAEDALVVLVRDQGHGFAPEELERLGEPFRRFDRAGAATGLGLGLVIAIALARRMGATLRISSRQGEGTVAALWLPKA
jgi:signal transduction histidine kinase